MDAQLRATTFALLRIILNNMRLASSLCFVLVWLAICNGGRCQSLTGTLRGTVQNSNQQPVPGITLYLSDSVGVQSDQYGNFIFSSVQATSYLLTASGVGYTHYQKRVTILPHQTTRIHVILSEATTELEEVTVRGKSIVQEKRELPIKVDVLDLQKIYARSSSVPHLINQTAGVKVRQTAGVGSGTTISINGLQGKAVRFFKDGVPLDYLGSAFDLSIVPIDLLQSVEIYKGVMPVSLGTDALGGGVNFVTRQDAANYLDISYGLSSFNTHQANLNGYFRVPESPFFISLSSYYSASDNDYQVHAPVVDEETRTREFRSVRRFHDDIVSRYGELKVGVKEQAWADVLEVGVALFGLQKDEQHSVLMTTPYGGVTSSERSAIISGRYQKEVGNWQTDIFSAYSSIQNTLTDTTRYRYNWLGEVVREDPFQGEIGSFKTLQVVDVDHWVARVNVSYSVGDFHQLYFNHNYVAQERVGSNPLGPKIIGTNTDPLTIPATYQKNVSGVGVTSRGLKRRLTNTFTVKRYAVQTESIDLQYAASETPTSAGHHSFGAGNSTKWSFDDDRFLRLSYEYATRIPDQEEYFGDALFVVGNPELRPERSHNINVGYYSYLNTRKTHWLDVNAYYRYQRDLIFLRPRIPFSQYENVDDARVLGVEVSWKSELSRHWSANANATYQDLRRVNVSNAAEAILEDSRIPNVPYFFVNAGVSYQYEDLLGKEDKLQVFTNYNYVVEYLLYPVPKSQEPGLFREAQIDSDLIIPTQHVVETGITYKLSQQPLWVNAEVHNLLNYGLYDQFRVQRAGRHFHIKLRYLLN